MPKLPKNFDPGKNIFSWVAHDYHPQQKGWIWISIFCLVVFGGAVWAFFSGDPVMAFTFFVIAAVYFWVHRNGMETHKISLTEKGIFIDEKDFFSWEKFSGFWFIYDETVSIINFQFRNSERKISLQMGQVEPDVFRTIFEKAEFSELLDKKESLVDLWIRALKL